MCLAHPSMHTPTQGEITPMLQLKSCSVGIAGEEIGCTVFLNPWISILLFKRGDQNPGRWALGAEAAQVILGPTVLLVPPAPQSFRHCSLSSTPMVSTRAAGAAGSSGGLWPESRCAGEFKTSPLLAVKSVMCPEWQTLIHNFTITLLSNNTEVLRTGHLLWF